MRIGKDSLTKDLLEGKVKLNESADPNNPEAKNHPAWDSVKSGEHTKVEKSNKKGCIYLSKNKKGEKAHFISGEHDYPEAMAKKKAELWAKSDHQKHFDKLEADEFKRN